MKKFSGWLIIAAIGLAFGMLCCTGVTKTQGQEVYETENVCIGGRPCVPAYGHPVVWRARYFVAPRAYSRKYPYAVPYSPEKPKVGKPYRGSSNAPKVQLIPTGQHYVQVPIETVNDEKATDEAPAPALYSNHPTMKQMVDECNRLRKASGRSEIKINEKLTVAAQKYAELCAATGGQGHFVGRTSPEQRIAAQGYQSSGSGEIWAGGYGSIQSAFNGWMRSRGHKNILLGNYQEVGFGFSVDSQGNPHSYVGVFANPR